MFSLDSFSPTSFSPTSFKFDGEIDDAPRNSAGFTYLEKQYKYKYNIEDEAVVVLEKAAKQRLESEQLVTLEKTFDDVGIVYRDAYKEAFTLILEQLRAEMQAAEDEQIAIIIASML